MTAALLFSLTVSAPIRMAPIRLTAYVSKTSAAMPAQSPTLSPTLSAIVAGLRGSSSSRLLSILPTRSAPTSREHADETGAEGDADEARDFTPGHHRLRNRVKNSNGEQCKPYHQQS